MTHQTEGDAAGKITRQIGELTDRMEKWVVDAIDLGLVDLPDAVHALVKDNEELVRAFEKAEDHAQELDDDVNGEPAPTYYHRDTGQRIA